MYQFSFIQQRKQYKIAQQLMIIFCLIGLSSALTLFRYYESNSSCSDIGYQYYFQIQNQRVFNRCIEWNYSSDAFERYYKFGTGNVFQMNYELNSCSSDFKGNNCSSNFCLLISTLKTPSMYRCQNSSYSGTITCKQNDSCRTNLAYQQIYQQNSLFFCPQQMQYFFRYTNSAFESTKFNHSCPYKEWKVQYQICQIKNYSAQERGDCCTIDSYKNVSREFGICTSDFLELQSYFKNQSLKKWEKLLLGILSLLILFMI